MARALVVLANGFEEIEAVDVIDILRRGDVEVLTASIDSDISVRGAHGMVMEADELLSDVWSDDFDAVILPGGGEGTANLKASNLVMRLLRRQKDEGRLICAICAAPTVLVAAGVLDEGQQITCYPTCQMDLDRPWVNRPVVVHGDVITGRAPGSATLFAFVVLKTLSGDSTAVRVAREMVSDVAF